MPISIQHRGSLRNIERFTSKMSTEDIFRVLDAAAQIGVDALVSATPKDTGATAAAWGYEVTRSSDRYSIHWTNDHINQGFSIVIGLQYGHGTGTGGYVAGRDFINPAMFPIFEALAIILWREVQNA